MLHTVQVLYMCTLCDSTNINAIIEFVPHVSGDGLYGGSDSYLQLRDTCGKRSNMAPTIILNNLVHCDCNVQWMYVFGYVGLFSCLP